jgi:hypothetical protein
MRAWPMILFFSLMGIYLASIVFLKVSLRYLDYRIPQLRKRGQLAQALRLARWRLW